MRFLAFADLHLHAYRPFATYDQGDNSRRLEILKRLEAIVALINQPKYDFGVFAGDFFHERLHVDVVSVAESKKVLAKLEKPLIMCSGTHDRTYSGHSSLSVFQDIFSPTEAGGSLWIDDIYGAQSTADGPVISVPHMGLALQMAAIRAHAQKPGILVTHGDVKGMRYGGMTCEDGLDLDELSELYSFVVLGHIHNPSASSGLSKPNVLIPGVCIPHSFGDVGPGRVCDVAVEFVRAQRSHVGIIGFSHPKFLTHDYRGVGGSSVTLNLEDYHRLLLKRDDNPMIQPEGARYVIAFSGNGHEQSVVDTTGLDHRTLLRSYVDAYGEEDKPLLSELGEKLASDVPVDEILDYLEEKLA
jgi:DNA repair exonuclease SbcCD nuclease subunit